MELFYYFIACLAFSLEFVDTVEFVKTQVSFNSYGDCCDKY